MNASRTGALLFGLALAGLLPWGCYYAFDGDYDPFRCAADCGDGKRCYLGRCVAPDGGPVDSPDTVPPCVHPTVAKQCADGWCIIPAGCFFMGSPKSEPCRDSDENQHQVTLTHSLKIAAHEVTQAEFLEIVGRKPAKFASCGASCPVEEVSWHEAVAYCNKLSAQKGLVQCYNCSGTGASVTCSEASSYKGQKIYDCQGYRLPTGAEWEYAYRAGTTAAYYNGANDSTKCTICSSVDANAADIGWYCANSGSATHPVAQKQANAWGLFDMAGNVWEWCHDRYVKDLGSTAVKDPWGDTSGSDRVVRGGSWNHEAGYMRAASRSNCSPADRDSILGFRCSRTTP